VDLGQLGSDVDPHPAEGTSIIYTASTGRLTHNPCFATLLLTSYPGPTSNAQTSEKQSEQQTSNVGREVRPGP